MWTISIIAPLFFLLLSYVVGRSYKDACSEQPYWNLLNCDYTTSLPTDLYESKMEKM
jgi:hypothetical protein